MRLEKACFILSGNVPSYKSYIYIIFYIIFIYYIYICYMYILHYMYICIIYKKARADAE